MLRVAVLASGRGSNLSALLAAAGEDAGFEVVGVFSDRADAGALQRARDAGIKAHALLPQGYPDRVTFDIAFFARVMQVQPDLIVCAGYMRIISAAALSAIPVPMINIHPSLLPRHPGLNTHARALESGDAEHGASVHLVIPALDAGPVIAQARLPLQPNEDAQHLAARVLELEHRLLPASVELFAQRRLQLRDAQPCLDSVPLPAPMQLRSSTLVQASQTQEEPH